MVQQSDFEAVFFNVATFANMQAPSYHGESVRYTGRQRKLTTKLVKVNFRVTLAATETKFKRGVALGRMATKVFGTIFRVAITRSKVKVHRDLLSMKTRTLKLPRY